MCVCVCEFVLDTLDEEKEFSKVHFPTTDPHFPEKTSDGNSGFSLDSLAAPTRTSRTSELMIQTRDRTTIDVASVCLSAVFQD